MVSALAAVVSELAGFDRLETNRWTLTNLLPIANILRGYAKAYAGLGKKEALAAAPVDNHPLTVAAAKMDVRSTAPDPKKCK